MKNILELNYFEANKFFLKKESYSSIELPTYYDFQKILDKVSKKLGDKKLKEFKKDNSRDHEDVNYKLLTNKDGKYSWRPFQLIHPAIYVNLINRITEEHNWDLIKERFKEFQKNEKIKCHSLPVISNDEERTNKKSQILEWWHKIEQQSLILSLDYRYVIHTDITDCYASIYTHSIPWAIHTKVEAKKKINRNNESLIGVLIDNSLQDMNYGQTNGIPQGSVLMDFIAEILLGYVDQLLFQKLNELQIDDYQILRFRDDYRIFTNNSFEAEQITKELSEILSSLGLKLNADKTKASDDIIKSSIKADKKYWIQNKRFAENKQKWLLQIYLLAEHYPNSGTVYTEMRNFLISLEKSKRSDFDQETLISIVTEIGIRNPRVIPTSIAILSILITKIKDAELKNKICNKISLKFNAIPNSSLIMVWFQRLYINIDKNIEYEEVLCKKIIDKSTCIWNSEWLNDSFKKIIHDCEIIKYDMVKKSKTELTKDEIYSVLKNSNYYE